MNTLTLVFSHSLKNLLSMSFVSYIFFPNKDEYKVECVLFFSWEYLFIRGPITAAVSFEHPPTHCTYI